MYKELCCEILRHAVEDYRKVVQRVISSGYEVGISTFKILRRDFKDTQYLSLSGYDPEFVLEKIDKEILSSLSGHDKIIFSELIAIY